MNAAVKPAGMPNNIIQFPINENQYLNNTTFGILELKPSKEKKDTSTHTFREPIKPLRTLDDIQAAKDFFLNRPSRYKNQNIRDYAIFMLGLNIARRCGDLLNLRVSDVLNQDGTIKECMTIREQKTSKKATLPITPIIKDTLDLYLPTLGDYKLSDPLFPSRQSGEDGIKKPMTVRNYLYKMKELSRELETSDNIGTHTMRKTWAYMTLVNNRDDAYIVAAISKALNHSSIAVTYRYLGIEQENINDLFFNNQLGV